jgi:hypothetical protein
MSKLSSALAFGVFFLLLPVGEEFSTISSENNQTKLKAA